MNRELRLLPKAWQCIFLASLCGFFFLPSAILAQTSSTSEPVTLPSSTAKTVEVSRRFDPSINEASKINFLPTLDDTLELPPKLTYTLYARPVTHTFPLRSIPPARMGTEKLPPLKYFYAKFGFGNYISPLAEIYISSPRAEKFTFGIAATHRSAFGKLTLLDSTKVKAPYSRSALQVFGDVALRNVAFHTGLYYRHVSDAFYGRLDTLYLAQNSLWNAKVQAHVFGAKVDFRSTYIDSSHFQYSGQLFFEGYADSHDMGQSHFAAEFAGHKYFRRECFGGTLRVDYLHKNLHPSVGANFIASFTPWAKLFGKRWRVWAGVDLTYEKNHDQQSFYFFPKGHISYDVVRNYFIPYFEIDGRLERADYVTIRVENAWLIPGLHVWNSPRQMELRGGVKGNFTPRMSYNFFVSYALVDSIHLFVNQVYGVEMGIRFSPLSLLSPFVVEYDNARELHAVGELSYSLTHRFSVAVRGDYWHYRLQELVAAWHRPMYSGLLRASYNLRQKVYVSLDFYLEGGSKARDARGDAIALEPIADLNFSARYQFVDAFSLFVDLRNILALNRSRYYLYPLHRFNGHAGVILNF